MDGPLKVLHVSTETGWRGGERQVSFLTDGLTARDVHCGVACVEGSPLYVNRRDAGIAVLPWKPVLGEWDFVAVRRLAKLATDFGANLIHAHTSHAHALALRAAKRINVPLVVSRRVDFPISRNGFSRRKYVDPHIDYIAISSAVANELTAGGVNAEKIHIVHSGIDPHIFPFRKENESPSRAETGRPVILNVAALTDHKDQETLLRALAELKRRGVAFNARIAGKGELEAPLRELSSALGLAEDVVFLGHVDDVPAQMADADIFVMTSHLEGLGTSLLDAMSAGIPVVATRAGGIPEIVTDGKTGLLAAVRDSTSIANGIQKILEDCSLAEQLRINAHQQVLSHFTYDAMTDGTLAVYQNILRSRT